MTCCLFIATHIDVQWRASQTSHHTSSTLGSSPLYSGNKYIENNLKYGKPLAEESYDIRYYSYYNVGDIYIYIYIYIIHFAELKNTLLCIYIYMSFKLQYFKDYTKIRNISMIRYKSHFNTEPILDIYIRLLAVWLKNIH